MDPEVGELSPGSLSALISSTQYEYIPLSGDETHVEGQADEPAQSVPSGEDSSSAGTETSAGEVATTPEPQLTPAVPAQAAQQFIPQPQIPQVNPLEAENQRLQSHLAMVLQRQNQERQAAQDRAFEESIKDLDEVEQKAARLDRANATLQLQNRYLQSAAEKARLEAEQVRRGVDSEREESAHTTLVAMVANEHGINSREGVAALLRATNMEELTQTAQYIGSLEAMGRTAAQPAEPAPIVQSIGQNRPVDGAGVEVADGAPVVAPKAGSNDLGSLISQTNYEVLPF